MFVVSVPHPVYTKLCLRSIQVTDREAIAKHANNPNVSQYLNNEFPFPYQLKDADYFISKIVEPKPDLTLAIATEVELIGVIGIVDHIQLDDKKDGSVLEIGYWLGQEYWGKGCMSSALQVFIHDYLFNKFPRLKRVIASVNVENYGSICLLKKIGFTIKEGAYEKNLEVLSLSLERE